MRIGPLTIGWEKERAGEGARAVSSTTWRPYASEFTAVEKDAKVNVYASMRDRIPPVARGLDIISTLVGRIKALADEPLAGDINAFIDGIRVNQFQRGLLDGQRALLHSMLLYGYGVVEIVPNNAGDDLYALVNVDARTLDLYPDKDNPLSLSVKQSVMGQAVELDPAWLVVALSRADGENPYGRSILASCPFVGELLLLIEDNLKRSWIRYGTPPYHGRILPPVGFSDPSGAKGAAILNTVKTDFLDAMRANKAGAVRDFWTVGDVTLSVIGASGEVLDFQVPYRALMEQICSAFGLPPWMLGFTWSTTERLAAEQSDMLRETIHGYQDQLEAHWTRLVQLWLDLTGRPGEFDLEWDAVSLTDAVEVGRAATLEAQAAGLREATARKLWETGVYSQEDYARETLGADYSGLIATPMTEPPAAAPAPFFSRGAHTFDDAHVTVGSGEVSKDRRVRELIAEMYGDIVTAWRKLRADIWAVLKLPTTMNFDAQPGPFTLTPEQEQVFQSACRRFLETMVGRELDKASYISESSDDGILQSYIRYAHAAGVRKAADLTKVQQSNLTGSEATAAVSRLLSDGFDKLTSNSRQLLSTQMDGITRVIEEGVAVSLNPLDVADRLRTEFDSVENYDWQRLARTEVAFAQNRGLLDEFKAEGIDTTGFDGEDQPPFHPNCVLEGTRCEASQVVAATRARYCGSVVEIVTAGGRRLAVTVNHPVLTTRGFVAAGELTFGDNVICHEIGNNGLGVNPDNVDVPPLVEEHFEALVEASGVPATRVPVASEDFHGDAAGFDGYVDVVWADGLLWRDGKTALPEHVGKNRLHRADFDASRLASDSPLTKLFVGALAATDGSVRSRSHGYALLLGELRKARPDLIGRWPELDAALFEDAGDDGAAETEGQSNSLLTLPAEIAEDKVIGIERRDFDGHVYDLQTLDTVYTANSVLTSNCMCAITIDPGTNKLVYDIAAQACEICQEYAQ